MGWDEGRSGWARMECGGIGRGVATDVKGRRGV